MRPAPAGGEIRDAVLGECAHESYVVSGSSEDAVLSVGVPTGDAILEFGIWGQGFGIWGQVTNIKFRLSRTISSKPRPSSCAECARSISLTEQIR